MNSLQRRFDQTLRCWRKLRSLIQERLADQPGLTIHSISNMERGIHGPRFAAIERLTELLQIDVAALFHLRRD